MVTKKKVEISCINIVNSKKLGFIYFNYLYIKILGIIEKHPPLST